MNLIVSHELSVLLVQFPYGNIFEFTRGKNVEWMLGFPCENSRPGCLLSSLQ